MVPEPLAAGRAGFGYTRRQQGEISRDEWGGPGGEGLTAGCGLCPPPAALVQVFCIDAQLCDSTSANQTLLVVDDCGEGAAAAAAAAATNIPPPPLLHASQPPSPPSCA